MYPRRKPRGIGTSSLVIAKEHSIAWHACGRGFLVAGLIVAQEVRHAGFPDCGHQGPFGKGALQEQFVSSGPEIVNYNGLGVNWERGPWGQQIETSPEKFESEES